MKFGSPSRMPVAPFCAAILVSAISSLPARSTDGGERETVEALKLVIVEDSLRPAAGKPPNFRVELRNTGKDDLVLHLGIMLANGRKQYPEAITLIISDFEGKSRTFQLRGPVGVAGRVDPMVVPLPAGATLSLPIDVANYWPVSSEEFDYKLRGGYSIEAKFTAENVPRVTNTLLAPYWVGVVTSNQLTFTVLN